MPLPISHSLAAAAIATAVDRDGRRIPVRRLTIAIVLACAADLDFLPGLVLGEPNRFHQGATHSLAVALAAGIAAGLWAVATSRPWPLVGRASAAGVESGSAWAHRLWPGAAGTAGLVAALWGSHVLLDAFTADPAAPIGVPMFWPMVDAGVHLGDVFPRADKASGSVGPIEWLASIASLHNLGAALFEVTVLGPVAAAVWWWRGRGGSPWAAR